MKKLILFGFLACVIGLSGCASTGGSNSDDDQLNDPIRSPFHHDHPFGGRERL